jgi:hypothetical protein
MHSSRVLLNHPKKESIALLDVLHKYSRRFTTLAETHHTMACFLQIVARWREGAGGPVTTGKGCRLDGRAICGAKDFFLLQIFQTVSGALPAPYSVGTGRLSPAVKLPGCEITTNLHLVLMLSMCGAMSPFLHVPSWFAQGQLYFCLSVNDMDWQQWSMQYGWAFVITVPLFGCVSGKCAISQLSCFVASVNFCCWCIECSEGNFAAGFGRWTV